MEYATLGNTGLLVSKLCFGTIKTLSAINGLQTVGGLRT
jgi:aryl-alcohol dehydrogenase-like predicted oxidoreductase